MVRYLINNLWCSSIDWFFQNKFEFESEMELCIKVSVS